MSRRALIELALTLMVAFVVAYGVRAAVASPYLIPSPSMEPTLHCAHRAAAACGGRFADRVLVNRLAYHFRDPHRGDVTVFEAPDAARLVCGAGGTYIKRIVGLPGEHIEIKDGHVHVDGVELSEPYAVRDHDSGSYRVPAGHYFFLGDNRADSCDSRLWGSVPRDDMVGPVMATYFPLDRIGTP